MNLFELFKSYLEEIDDINTHLYLELPDNISLNSAISMFKQQFPSCAYPIEVVFNEITGRLDFEFKFNTDEETIVWNLLNN